MDPPLECGPDEKVCSSFHDQFCASTSNPSAGCASPSCQQCPFDENTDDIECTSDGRCAVVCSPGFGDCDSDPGTCETDLATPEACGACDKVCEGEHVAESGCSDGVCTIVTCEKGYFNQDEDDENGCESQDPCPLEPPRDLSACDVYDVVCAYEEEDICAVCTGAYWDVEDLDRPHCWDQPSNCPMYSEPYPRYCKSSEEDAVCCYTFKGEPRGFQICNGEEWIQQPETYYEDYCP